MLMSLLLDCPEHMDLGNPYAPALKCPSEAEIEVFQNAVANGDIFWNAVPFNFQVENMSPLLFEAGINMTRRPVYISS